MCFEGKKNMVKWMSLVKCISLDVDARVDAMLAKHVHIDAMPNKSVVV